MVYSNSELQAITYAEKLGCYVMIITWKRLRFMSMNEKRRFGLS